MALPSGNNQGYNEIQIVGSDAAIGDNHGINEAEPIASKGDKAFQGKIASPAGTVHKRPQPSQNKTRVSAADSDGTSSEKRKTDLERNGLRRTKNGSCGRWGSGWPCGALVIVSLASPEQPRKAGSQQQWPMPTIFLRAKSQSFPMYSRAKRQLSQYHSAVVFGLAADMPGLARWRLGVAPRSLTLHPATLAWS